MELVKKMFDLVEGRWSKELNAYVKVATHKTNVPFAICKDEQKKREGNGVATRANSIRFKIVPNGELQYSNTFILNTRKRWFEKEYKQRSSQGKHDRIGF